LPDAGWSFLERAEDALRKLSLELAMLKITPTLPPPSVIEIGSGEDMGVELYDCFSPCVGDSSPLSSALPSVPSTTEGEAIVTVVPPVLEIMPELQELCESSVLPLSVEHVKVDSPMALSLPERSDVVSMTVAPLPILSPDALFAKELCDVLSKLEVDIPGCGRAIACLLTGTAIKSNGKKVDDCPRMEKSMKGKHKKSGTIGKMPAATQ
jgi:hypothetical protein